MTIEEYFGTLQQSFVEIWKNHLQTSKYAAHKALNEYYDDIVDCVDGLIEAWMGINGKIGELKNTINTKFDDPISYLEELKKFTKEGRKELINKDDTELWSCTDDILTLIDSTLYKLKELKEDNGMKSLKDYIIESLNITDFLNEQLVSESTERWIEFVWIDDEDCPKANAWLESNHKMSLSKFSEYLYDNLVTGDHDGNIFSSQGHSTAKEIKDAFNLKLPDGSRVIDVADELEEMPEVQNYIDEYGGSIGHVLYISED